MTLNTFYSMSSAINAITSFTLGFFILLKNPRSRLHQLWWWMSFCITIWAVFHSIFFGPASHYRSIAFIMVRIANTGAFFISLLYLHFTITLLHNDRLGKLLKTLYALHVLVACFAFTPLFIPDIQPISGLSVYPNGGPLFLLFFILYILESGYAIYLTCQASQHTTGLQKTRLRYVLTACTIGFIFGGTSFLPCFNIPIPPIGFCFVWLHCLFIAWAVFKYQLFDIHVIIRRSLLYSIFLAFLVLGYFGLVYAAQQLFRMTLLQHHILALSLTAITTFGLGLLVFLAEPKRRLNQIFGLYSLCITWWAVGEAAFVGAHNQTTAYFFDYLDWPGVIFIAPTFIHTVFLFTKERSTFSKFTLTIAYTVSFTFLIAHLLFGSILQSVRPVAYIPFFSNLTSLGKLISVVFFILVNIALWKLLRAFQSATGHYKTQLKYLFWSSVIGYIGGSPDWLLVFGLHIPFLNPFGIYGVPMYSIATTYAVLQHRLFDVNLVIRKSLIYSLLITLLTIGYFGLVYGIERLFQAAFGYQSIWLSLISFSLMALLFQPLKMGIQRFVDFLFFHMPHEELAQRMERLEEQALQTEKLKAITTLAAGLSHELRNPLQIIQTHAEFLPERYDDPQFRERCSEAMKTEISRINDLLKQLMEFAKPKNPTFQPLEPHKILDSTLNLLDNDFVKRQAKLEKQYNANGTVIQADADQLRQVILNLVMNALEAMENGGTVTVTTFRKENRFALEIADTGPGISPEIASKLFEPFTTTKLNGNGLGLSIVHGIVTEHNGAISVQSKPGQGTTFTIQFPVV